MHAVHAVHAPVVQVVQVVQHVVLRLKQAVDADCRRLQAGEVPGYPRVRGRGRSASVTFPQVAVGGALATEATRLVVAKVGRIKVVLHRALDGTPKTATLRRTAATGTWLVSIACEWEPAPRPPTGCAVGLDVGLKVVAMPTLGRESANPRCLREEEQALAKAQRTHHIALDAHKAIRAALSEHVKAAQPAADARRIGSLVSQDAGECAAWRQRRQRQRRRRVVARTPERIRWRRNTFTQQARRRLVDPDDCLAVADLSVRNMVRNHALAKRIHDAAWTPFAAMLRDKAAWGSVGR